MRTLRYMLFCVAVLFPLSSVSAQEQKSDSPPWVYLKLGEKAFRGQEYGEALKNYRIALGKQSVYPEAEVGIGMVFQVEGEFALAETQYRKALSERSFFSVPDDYYRTLYLLSEIYAGRKKYRDFEETLLSILSEDELHTSTEKKALSEAMTRAVHDRSLDKVIELYRLDADFSLRAYRDLGVFYYETGRYAQAVHHLTMATVKIFTAVIDELRRLDPDYRYTGIGAVLETAAAVPSLRDFIISEELYRVLYHLGASVYAETRNTSVKSIWSLIMNRKEAGVWATRAANQYRKPYIEPVTAY